MGGALMLNDKSLRSSELFAGVPADVFQAALKTAARVRVKRGSCFYRTDEPAHRLFVLVSGRVKLRLLTPSGYRMLFRFISPGDFFGYQAVLNDSANYFATAEAAEESEAACWSRTATRTLLRSHPAIAVNALST
jgi:CRP-like cAMP-binding protein